MIWTVPYTTITRTKLDALRALTRASNNGVKSYLTSKLIDLNKKQKNQDILAQQLRLDIYSPSCFVEYRLYPINAWFAVSDSRTHTLGNLQDKLHRKSWCHRIEPFSIFYTFFRDFRLSGTIFFIIVHCTHYQHSDWPILSSLLILRIHVILWTSMIIV